MKPTTPGVVPVTPSPKIVAGTDLRADFKPPVAQRKIRFATLEEVQKAGEKIDLEFAGAFKILAE